MKKIELTCVDCGIKRFSFGRNERCNPCATMVKYAESRSRIKKSLEDIGHIGVEFTGIMNSGKMSVTFIHSVCGTQQTWQASNITKQLKERPTIAPCSKCGAAERTAKATKASAEARGVPDHLLSEWEAYRRKTRRLSEQTYRANKATINPLNLKRGTFDYHLDHKFPIIEGFLQGIDPERLAAVDNLQLLPAKVNLSKGRQHP